jgi:S-adenosylmethionine decarboxylase
MDATASNSALGANSEVYGQHLSMRVCDVANRQALDSENAVRTYLLNLVEAIGMTILAGPLVARESAPEARSGISGVVILQESHVALHTYPRSGQAFLDVFSCKPFSPAIVAEITAGAFGSFTTTEHRVADRGHHWASNVRAELARWSATR